MFRRAKYKPDAIDARSIEAEAKQGKLFQHGFDKFGRPLVYMYPARSFSTDYASGVKLLVVCVTNHVSILHLISILWKELSNLWVKEWNS
jgi:hypothetical protein